MTSMGSLSLQASQEVPVLRHEIQLVGETSTPSRGKGQGHRRQGPPLVLRLRARLAASALRVGPLPPFLGVFKSTFTHCSLSRDFKHRPPPLGQIWEMGTVVWPHLT